MNLTTILIIVNVFAALIMIVLVLMQQAKGDMGSAFGGGGSQSMFGSRGSANFLSRATSFICALFFISSLTLAYIYSNRNANDSVVGSGSVIQDSTNDASQEIPSVDDGSVPVIEGDLQTIPDAGSIPEVNSVPEVIEGASEAINEASDSTLETTIDSTRVEATIESNIEDIESSIIEDLESSIEEVPAVPEQ